MAEDPSLWGDDPTDLEPPLPGARPLPPPRVTPDPRPRPPGAPSGPHQPPPGAAPPAPVSPTSPPSPALPPPWRWRSTVLTLVVVLALVAGGAWVALRDDPVELEVDGRPIVNAEVVLDRAEAAFDQIVDADGAEPHDDAGCWFTPAEDDATARGPQLACGPVLLGVAGTSEPWVLGTVDYSTSGSGDETTGSFRSLDDVGDPDTGGFARPDGREVPSASDLEPSTAGIRAADGRRLVGAEVAIEAADDDFLDAADDAGASVSDDSACFFGGSRTRAGQFLAEDEIWCGPVLLLDSDPQEAWTRWSFSVRAGASFALAEASRPSITSLSTTIALDAGLDLARPDGREPARADDLELPDADAVADDFVDVLEELPGTVDLEAPADGRLVIPSRSLTVTGLARVPKIGSGREAVVASKGHELVVVEHEVTPTDGGPLDRGTAQLVVDGRRIPFTDWGSLDGTATLVVSVPDDAREVDLEVLFDGRTQRLSLLTGERAAGAPAALYRASTSVGVGVELAVSAALPVGDPVSAGGVVTEARVLAWTDEHGWAPDGQAFLVLTTEGWGVDRPCCDLGSVTVTPVFTVTPAGGGAVPGATASTTDPEPVFVVPAVFTDGTITLSINVTFVQDGQPGSVDSAPATLELRVPG